MILLDTSVISELVSRQPEPAVEAFLQSQPPLSIYTASVCEAEIRYGLARMPAGRRRNELTRRTIELFATAFPDRILTFDSSAADLYGVIRASRERAGRPISVEDAMIAATARAYGVALATRNEHDFVGCGVHVINPWSPGALQQQ